MVKNWSRRTLNRIYACIADNACVTKTTTNTQLADELSRQLLVPVARKDENKTVMLESESSRVTKYARPVTIVQKGYSSQAVTLHSVRGVISDSLLDRPIIREVMISADHANKSLAHPTLRLNPTLSKLAAAKIGSNNRDSKSSDAASTKNSLTSPLAINQGRIAHSVAFIDRSLIQNLPMSLTVMGIAPNKHNCFRMPVAKTHVYEVNRAQSVEINIKIHIAAPRFKLGEHRHDVSMQNPSRRRLKNSAIAMRIPKNRLITGATASNDNTRLNRTTRFEFTAMQAHKKLVERIYDG